MMLMQAWKPKEQADYQGIPLIIGYPVGYLTLEQACEKMGWVKHGEPFEISEKEPQ